MEQTLEALNARSRKLSRYLDRHNKRIGEIAAEIESIRQQKAAICLASLDLQEGQHVRITRAWLDWFAHKNPKLAPPAARPPDILWIHSANEQFVFLRGEGKLVAAVPIEHLREHMVIVNGVR